MWERRWDIGRLMSWYVYVTFSFLRDAHRDIQGDVVFGGMTDFVSANWASRTA